MVTIYFELKLRTFFQPVYEDICGAVVRAHVLELQSTRFELSPEYNTQHISLRRYKNVDNHALILGLKFSQNSQCEVPSSGQWFLAFGASYDSREIPIPLKPQDQSSIVK